MAFVLASTSPIRLQLLRSAGLTVEAVAPRVDEETARVALLAEGAKPRDVADTLAELKARKVADKRPGDLVLEGLRKTRKPGPGTRSPAPDAGQNTSVAVGHRCL